MRDMQFWEWQAAIARCNSLLYPMITARLLNRLEEITETIGPSHLKADLWRDHSQ